jgi:hypothetical protein
MFRERLYKLQRERETILFSIPMALFLWLFYEMNRRQTLGETREESRRLWVDGEIARLSDGELGHRERSEGIRNIGRVIAWGATVVIGVAALLSLFAAHVL